MVILIVEQEGDEGCSKSVALTHKANLHLYLLIAFDQFVRVIIRRFLCDSNRLGFALLEFLCLIEQLLLLSSTAGNFHNHLASEITRNFKYEAVLQTLLECGRLIVLELLI